MRPITVIGTAVGNGETIRVDYRQSDFKIGIGCTVSGTINYSLEHSFDGTSWFVNDDIATDTTSEDTNYAFPIWAVRLVVHSESGGSVTMTLLQGS